MAYFKAHHVFRICNFARYHANNWSSYDVCNEKPTPEKSMMFPELLPGIPKSLPNFPKNLLGFPNSLPSFPKSLPGFYISIFI